MPYHKKRKTNRPQRGLIPENQMKTAVDQVLAGQPVNTVARVNGIDRMTLKRYVRKTRINADTACKPSYVTKQIFNVSEEKVLADYLLKASKLHYGLSTKTSRKLAFDFASCNNKTMPISWHSNQCAGKDWLRDFLRRSGSLSLRTPEATSFSRSTAWNKQTKDEFFANLRDARTRHDYPPQNIYNVDETALTTVQRPAKIIAGKGTKQVGRMTSAERGTLITACCCVSAIGNSIPPYFVFPRVHFKSNMIAGGPSGCAGTAYPSGWMTSENFLLWMNHFAKFCHCSVANPVLLLLDNHESHISYDCLQFAKQNGITMVSFPPHTTHKLQPLDVSVYGPLKRYYNAECDDWMVSNARPMTIFDIVQVASPAFVKAFTPSNIIAGFQKTGIEPFNSSKFDNEDEFLAASVTDRPLPADNVGQHKPADLSPTEDAGPAATSGIILEQILPQNEVGVLRPTDEISGAAMPTPPAVTVDQTSTPSTSRNIKHAANTPIEELMQFPKAGPRKCERGRERIKSQILTDTPVRDKMRQAQERKVCRAKNAPGAKKMKLADSKEQGSEKKQTRKEKATNCMLKSTKRPSKKTHVPNHQSVPLVEPFDESWGQPDENTNKNDTIENSEINENDRSARPKRIGIRRFSLAEALKAIEADSDTD